MTTVDRFAAVASSISVCAVCTAVAVACGGTAAPPATPPPAPEATSAPSTAPSAPTAATPAESSAAAEPTRAPAAPTADAPPPEATPPGGKNIVYRMTASGLVIDLDGIQLEPRAEPLKLGIPGDQVPGVVEATRTATSNGDHTDTSLGLAFHSDSAYLRGMLSRMSIATRANVNGVVIPARSENDTSNNPHNPLYGIQKLFEFYINGGNGAGNWVIVKADNFHTGAFPLTPRFTVAFATLVNLGGIDDFIQPGVWYQYEVIVNRNGRLQMWIRQQGGTPQVVYDGTPSGMGAPNGEFLFWWWGYGGVTPYSGPTSYIYHNHMRVSYTP